MTDYEKIYQKNVNACCEPFIEFIDFIDFIEFIDFFDQLEKTNLNVLVLGCGQGRDALFIALKGHGV